MRAGHPLKIDLSEAVDVEPGGFEPLGRRSKSFLATWPPAPHQPPPPASASLQYRPRAWPISSLCAARHRMVRILFTFTLNTPWSLKALYTVAGVFALSGPSSRKLRASLFFSSADRRAPTDGGVAVPDSKTRSAASSSDLRRYNSSCVCSIAAISARIVSSTLDMVCTMTRVAIRSKSENECAIRNILIIRSGGLAA